MIYIKEYNKLVKIILLRILGKLDGYRDVVL
jgi:hypothetical protein